jgi:hypothetical protein
MHIDRSQSTAGCHLDTPAPSNRSNSGRQKRSKTFTQIVSTHRSAPQTLWGGGGAQADWERAPKEMLTRRRAYGERKQTPVTQSDIRVRNAMVETPTIDAVTRDAQHPRRDSAAA